MDLSVLCTLKPLADGAVSYLQAMAAVSKEAKSKVAAVPEQQGVCVCIVYGVVCSSEIPCNTKIWRGGRGGGVWGMCEMRTG